MLSADSFQTYHILQLCLFSVWPSEKSTQTAQPSVNGPSRRFLWVKIILKNPMCLKISILISWLDPLKPGIYHSGAESKCPHFGECLFSLCLSKTSTGTAMPQNSLRGLSILALRFLWLKRKSIET